MTLSHSRVGWFPSWRGTILDMRREVIATKFHLQTKVGLICKSSQTQEKNSTSLGSECPLLLTTNSQQIPNMRITFQRPKLSKTWNLNFVLICPRLFYNTRIKNAYIKESYVQISTSSNVYNPTMNKLGLRIPTRRHHGYLIHYTWTECLITKILHSTFEILRPEL